MKTPRTTPIPHNTIQHLKALRYYRGGGGGGYMPLGGGGGG